MQTFFTTLFILFVLLYATLLCISLFSHKAKWSLVTSFLFGLLYQLGQTILYFKPGLASDLGYVVLNGLFLLFLLFLLIGLLKTNANFKTIDQELKNSQAECKKLDQDLKKSQAELVSLQKKGK